MIIMKQQELINIHALLFEVSEDLKQSGAVTTDCFAQYEAQPTRPHHIHRGKEAHKTAINYLLRGFSPSVRPAHQRKQTVETETRPP